MGQEVDRVRSSSEDLYGSGGISDESAKALEKLQPEQIEEALGEVSASSELLLVSVLVDDSTSIALNMDQIRYGYGQLLKALRSESFRADVQVQARAMNRGLVYPYTTLARAATLTEDNYNGSKLVPDTPLFLQSLLMLGTVMLKTQEEEGRGTPVRTFTLIITDGEDNRSGEITAGHVRAVVADMREFHTNHIVAGMGVGDGRDIDFRDVFRDMGIPERWRFAPGASIKDLQKAFRIIAKALQLAASSEAGFAQLLLGPPSDS